MPAAQALPDGKEPARNAPCPCGSGRKYKHCCGSDARMAFAQGTALLQAGRWRDAAESLARAARFDPAMAAAQYHLGLALTQLGRVSEAMAAYRAAIALAPNLVEAHLQLGELLSGRRYAAPAIAAFEAAAAIEAGTSRGCWAAARALIIGNRGDEAMEVLRRGLATNPASAVLRRLLAKTLAEAGRFDEAWQEYERALAGDDANAAGYFEMVMSRQVTPQNRPMLERIAARLDAPGVDAQGRMVLHFSLGKAHDDLGEFEAAMRHFDAANAIRGGAAPLNRRLLAALVDRNIELFPDRAAFDAALGVDDERPVFIVGLPRSGTTLVEQIISSHPAVAAGGELGYWGEHGSMLMQAGATPFDRDRLHALATGFQALLRGVSAEALRVTDKNPFNYLFVGLLRLAFPRAFIIHCRRHPVDACLSMYMTLMGARETWFMGNRDDLVFYHGEYSRLMRHWRAVLPPERLLELDYEAVTGDAAAAARRIVAFCELEWDEACLRPEANRRSVATASVWQARQAVYRGSVGRWRNYAPWLGALAELLPAGEKLDF